jgi:hypothetical protein
MVFWRLVHWTGLGATPPHCAALDVSQGLLDSLLESFSDLFEEPTDLPPPRRHDHHIHLLPGTTPVAVRPYCYPQLLKDEIERQYDQMLHQVIIRECTSTFSSPILLVKKANKTWRFCIDYRELNATPVVKELLDELRRAHFTKLDLRSGYHQVRMHPDDIDKTTLMNEVLKSLICKCVLVFFDDNLIFSKSWAEHLQHVKQVFQLLREHKLALKRSKCSFAAHSVAYLSHIISNQGVSMDPSKVDAVESWPRPQSLRALRGFLGLTGYYRKFIAGYGAVAAPLTALLKREAFKWSEEAKDAFSHLKQSLMTAPLLRYLGSRIWCGSAPGRWRNSLFQQGCFSSPSETSGL